MVGTRSRNYGPLVRTPPRRAPRPKRPEYAAEGMEAINKLWDDDPNVMTNEGGGPFTMIRRDQYPEVRMWVRENLNYLLPAWDPLTQLAPPSIPRGIVNGFGVQCENYRTKRIRWVQQQGQERGHFINPDKEGDISEKNRCRNSELDCQNNEMLDFMPCQGDQYELREDGRGCGIWVCTDCTEHEYKQWDFSIEMSRLLVHCWDCSQHATKSGTKTGSRSYVEQLKPNVNPDNNENSVVWAGNPKGRRWIEREAAQRRRHCGCRKRFAPVAHTKKRTRRRSFHLCSGCRWELYGNCRKSMIRTCEDPELGLTKRDDQRHDVSFLVEWVDDSDNKNRNHCRCDPPSGPRDWPEIIRSYGNLDKEQRLAKGFRMCLYCKLPTKFDDATGGRQLVGQSTAWW